MSKTGHPRATEERQAGRSQGELEMLLIAEFGNSTELMIRFSVILCGAFALYVMTGSWIGPIWASAYLLSQLLNYRILVTTPPNPSRLRFWSGVYTYLLTTVVFMAMPLGLLLFGTQALAYCGGMALVALCVFTLWREQPPAVLLPYDIALGYVMAGAAIYVVAPAAESLLASVMVVILTLTATSYYALALISTRRNRMRLREAAERGVQAQKMEAIGRLSGGVAHDFNNILTVLQGNLELYEEVTDSEERHLLVAEAHAASLRASALVAQLLSFARRAPLDIGEVDAESILAEIGAMAARLLPSSIEVVATPPRSQLRFAADRTHLMSALLNLVINARDAMEGHGRLDLRATAVPSHRLKHVRPALPDGLYVRFSVCDTGPGMTAEIAAQAIEPFFTTKSVGEGSGLGLPSAKGFAEQSGGALDITSEGCGATVSLYLPLIAAPVPETPIS